MVLYALPYKLAMSVRHGMGTVAMHGLRTPRCADALRGLLAALWMEPMTVEGLVWASASRLRSVGLLLLLLKPQISSRQHARRDDATTGAGALGLRARARKQPLKII